MKYHQIKNFDIKIGVPPRKVTGFPNQTPPSTAGFAGFWAPKAAKTPSYAGGTQKPWEALGKQRLNRRSQFVDAVPTLLMGLYEWMNGSSVFHDILNMGQRFRCSMFCF